VLEQAAGLSSRALEAIAELERRVIAADGGRLKLEWGTLRRRNGEQVEDLLWWEDEELLGFLGFYRFGSSLELAGMVAPNARRRGIGTALLDAAAAPCRALGYDEGLLIVPRPSEAGKRLALRRGGALDHSEHALVLSGDPISGRHEPALSIRPASTQDIPEIARMLAAGFGEPGPDDLAERLNSGRGRIVVVELRGAPVGTLHLRLEGDEGGIYGFVIDPPCQGRGLGRDALRRTCEQLRGEGARRIGLEVAVENDRALGLYESVGFTPVITEDYYALPLS
jgi:ribosomal protein S18 acetylase RimI-like enzyme